jgi:aryl-alcohol dehydrogenase-like predicted oxidoreductase
VIATKGGFERPGPDNWITNGKPRHLRRALEGSLRRLKVDRIDVWQLHRIDPSVPEDDQFEVLENFVKRGVVRHVGLSEVGVDAIDRARRVLPIVSVQNRYNVNDREWESVVDHCEQHRIAFIPWRPIGAGSLTSNRGAQQTDRIGDVARKHGATALQVGLAWLLARSPAMLVIPGTSKVSHLEENVAAAALELDDEDLRTLGNAAP